MQAKNRTAQNLVSLRWGNPKRKKRGLKQLAKAREALRQKRLSVAK